MTQEARAKKISLPVNLITVTQHLLLPDAQGFHNLAEASLTQRRTAAAIREGERLLRLAQPMSFEQLLVAIMVAAACVGSSCEYFATH